MEKHYKSLTDFILESLENHSNKINEEGTIKTEDDFEEVFGDDLDEEKMNDTIDGILKDNPVPDGKEVEDLDESELEEYWGELIGILNKSFGA